MQTPARVVILVIFSALVISAAPQLQFEGEITSTGPNVETYVVRLFELVLGPDRLLSNALAQGRGQYVSDKKLLVTSEEITQISRTSIQVRVAATAASDAPKEAKDFSIAATTKFCREGKAVAVATFKVGEMVTITSNVGSKAALSIRSGPMAFSGMGSGPGVLTEVKNYNCG